MSINRKSIVNVRRAAERRIDRGPVLHDAAPDFEGAFGTRLQASDIRTQPDGAVDCVGYAFVDAIETWFLEHAGDLPAPTLSIDDAAAGASNAGMAAGYRNALRGITHVHCCPPNAKKPCINVKDQRRRVQVAGLPVAPNSRVREMRRAIDNKQPLVAAFLLYDGFRHFTGHEALRPVAGSPVIGAHAVCVLGYECDERGTVNRWLIKNCWGTDWGVGGFGRIRVLDSDLKLESVVYRIHEVDQ
jgi:hypothetical protein